MFLYHLPPHGRRHRHNHHRSRHHHYRHLGGGHLSDSDSDSDYHHHHHHHHRRRYCNTFHPDHIDKPPDSSPLPECAVSGCTNRAVELVQALRGDAGTPTPLPPPPPPLLGGGIGTVEREYRRQHQRWAEAVQQAQMAGGRPRFLSPHCREHCCAVVDDERRAACGFVRELGLGKRCRMRESPCCRTDSWLVDCPLHIPCRERTSEARTWGLGTGVPANRTIGAGDAGGAAPDVRSSLCLSVECGVYIGSL